MKNLLKWIIAVLAIVAGIDVVFGFASRYYLNNYRLRGDYRSIDHLFRDSLEDIIVLGSSVGQNSIDTRMLADSLGVSAYNCGSNGQEFPFYLTLMEIIAQKSGPKTIILGMKEDALENTGLGARYNFLMPYYKTGYYELDNRLEKVDAVNKLMFNSSLYRYNNIWFRILLYSVYEPGVIGDNGFIAKDIPTIYPDKDYREIVSQVTDERKSEFNRFVQLCRENDMKLIVCCPPRYEIAGGENYGRKYLEDRVQEGDFELWYDVYDPCYGADSTLFYDREHLNCRGAAVYTREIINRLRDDVEH